MTTWLLRFLGDPTGYLIDWDSSSDRPNGWLWAEVGTTGRRVRVNADLAYLVERWSPYEDALESARAACMR